uniref:THO complex subunit 1 n=1 Tax=Chenopodium quinoa TaxID=63459 RepID=A0A803MR01_CHEQI
QEIFRKALLNPEPPEKFALQTVQEAIKPQRQTKLVLDENQLLENILRTLLQELVSCAVQSGEPTMHYGRSIAEGVLAQGQIPRLLDIVLYLCEKEHVEGGMIFQLLEDLTEMSTMKNCKDIFAYIESKQDLLGKQELFARGKLVMLRTCNQLLRRLSKSRLVAKDVEDGLYGLFFGNNASQHLILHISSLVMIHKGFADPSLPGCQAVNIKGVFNTSNETKYEKEAPNGISIDFNFYKTFWSLQEYFCNPPSLTVNPTKWHRFTSSLSVVLNTFEAQPLSDEEGNANNLEEEGAAVNIKYLTSSKLMGLELKDPSFWRHVLVQCLILFDYVKKEEIKTYEERVKNLLEVTPPRGKEFLCSIEHILEREKNWVWWKRDGCPPFEKQQLEKKVDGTKKRPLALPTNPLTPSPIPTLLPKPPTSPGPPLEPPTPPSRPLKNSAFLHCPVTAKEEKQEERNKTHPPTITVTYVHRTRLKSQSVRVDTTRRGHRIRVRFGYLHSDTLGLRPRWRLGNKELSQLWKWADQNPNALTDPERVKTPAVTDYWKPMADDMDPSAGIEAEYHHKNNKVYCWKGLRFSARQDLEDFSRFTEFGIEGVVPLELMPPEVRSKYQAKPNDKSKRVKKDETKGSVPPSEENQTLNSVSEMDGEGGQNDLDAPAAAMDLDSTPITGNNSQAGTPTPDDFLKQSSESPDAQEAGELDAEADPEPGLIDGETDADVDLDAVG